MTVLSAPVQAVLALFERDLKDVRFGDLDAACLAGLVAEVESAADAVAAAEARVDAARTVLDVKQEALLKGAQRALAYARVYAESAGEELRAEVHAITLPRVATPAPSEPVRARRRRAREDSAAVTGESSAAAAE